MNALLFQSGSLAFLEEHFQILRASKSRCQVWPNYGVLDCNLKVIKQVSTEATHLSKEENNSYCKQVCPFHVRSEDLDAQVTGTKPLGAEMRCKGRF